MLYRAPQQYLVRKLYDEHVCIAEAANVEIMTRNQSQSSIWNHVVKASNNIIDFKKSLSKKTSNCY